MKRVCIVGSGPAGFFMSKRLLKAGHRIVMLEKLGSPFGLVADGIAPDNQGLKTVKRISPILKCRL